MLNKKVGALLLTSVLSGSMVFTGCSSSSETTSATESAAAETASEETTSKTGRVTANEDSVLTVSVSNMGGGDMGGGTPPDMPEGEAPGNADGKALEGDAAPADMPEGEMPESVDAADAENADDAASTENADNAAESADGNAPDADVPEKPEGDGEAPEKPEGDLSGEETEITITVDDAITLTDADGNAITVDDIAVGEFITITYNADDEVIGIALGGEPQMQMGMGGNVSDIEYTAAYEYTEDAEESGQSYDSTGTDENTVYVSSDVTVSIDNASITRTSDDSTGGDNSSFYGVGASVLNTAGILSIADSTITSDAAGGAGVFSYGDGVTYVSDTTIDTTQDTSGGIHVAGGGTLYAWNLDVTTAGTSSAAIRSDRGSGTMVVDGGTYTSNGNDSPAVYVTADIAINDATLISNAAEGVAIEGLNSLHLFNSDLTSSMTADERNDVVWNVIVYQSMSGDSEEGNGTYSMVGGSITASEGGIFYTTNTESTFYLNDVDITYPSETDFFLRATGNSNQRGWGTSGANGANTNFTADNQVMAGDIITDSISNLDFYMMNASQLTGAFVQDESAAGNGGDGETNAYISADSTWVVTGDSVLTNLYNEGTIVDEEGNAVTIVDVDGNVLVEGTSGYTITVSNYGTSADFSNASSETSFSDYEVEKLS